jgi:hypothetical protein
MPDIPPHAWFREKLQALLAEAETAGYTRDVAEAVITDLMNGALAAPAPPPDENWARDQGEPTGAASEMPAHRSVTDEGLLQETQIDYTQVLPHGAI